MLEVFVVRMLRVLEGVEYQIWTVWRAGLLSWLFIHMYYRQRIICMNMAPHIVSLEHWIVHQQPFTALL
jgi:hypothetical protein